MSSIDGGGYRGRRGKEITRPGLTRQQLVLESDAQTVTTSRTCDLCGARENRARYLVDGYHIVQCGECSLCFVSDEVTPEQLEAYYDEGYYQGDQYQNYMQKGESKRGHYRAMLPSLKKHLPPGDRLNVLDVGCAAGYFLDVANEQGWHSQGIELSAFAAARAREQGHEVFNGSINEARLPTGELDLVTMWDVIEHLQSPDEALALASRSLRNGGILVVATGDIEGFTARVFGSKWALLAPPGHLFYFSRRTLTAMLRKHGFEPIEWLSDGAGLANSNRATGFWSRLILRIHGWPLVGALLRRLHLGSIVTVYARKCGNS